MPRTKYSIGYKHGEGFEEYSVSIEVFSDQSDVRSSEMASLLLDTIEAVESRIDQTEDIIPVEDGGGIEGSEASNAAATAESGSGGSHGQNGEQEPTEEPAAAETQDMDE